MKKVFETPCLSFILPQWLFEHKPRPTTFLALETYGLDVSLKNPDEELFSTGRNNV